MELLGIIVIIGPLAVLLWLGICFTFWVVPAYMVLNAYLFFHWVRTGTINRFVNIDKPSEWLNGDDFYKWDDKEKFICFCACQYWGCWIGIWMIIYDVFMYCLNGCINWNARMCAKNEKKKKDEPKELD